MTRIGLLSDTHGYIDDQILRLLSEVDEIWHAGDIGDLKVMDQLASIRPVVAVWGNIDGAMRASVIHKMCTQKETVFL